MTARQDTEDAPRLRVKWKAKKGDPTNGGYSQELLHKAFSKVYYPIMSCLDVFGHNLSDCLVFNNINNPKLLLILA